MSVSVGPIGAAEPEPEPEPDDEGEQVDRELYRPEDPDWMAQEERLIQHMKQVNREREKTLKAEPEGIDSLLVQGGFEIPGAGGNAAGGGGSGGGRQDAVLDAVEEQVVSVSKRPGYDLVRVCNIDETPERFPQEIAFCTSLPFAYSH